MAPRDQYPLEIDLILRRFVRWQMRASSPIRWFRFPLALSFFRVADEPGDGVNMIEPVAVYAAGPGDFALISGKRVGRYLGGGEVLGTR